MIAALGTGLGVGLAVAGVTSLKVFLPASGPSRPLFYAFVVALGCPALALYGTAHALAALGRLDVWNWQVSLCAAGAVWIAAIYRYLFRAVVAPPTDGKTEARRESRTGLIMAMRYGIIPSARRRVAIMPETMTPAPHSNLVDGGTTFTVPDRDGGTTLALSDRDGGTVI